MSQHAPRTARSPWKPVLLACLALVLLGLTGWWLWASGPDTHGVAEGQARRSPASGSTVAGARGDAPSAPPGTPAAAPQGAEGSLWLEGLVTEEQGGAPLESVEVLLRANALSTLDRTLSATTDAEGHYRLGPMPPGLYDVFFHKPRYLSHDVSAHAVRASGSLDVVLAPALLVEGQVVDEAGQPVPKAHVRLRSKEVIEDEEDFRTVADEDADEAGRFVLDAPEPGPWTIEAHQRDYLYGYQDVTAPASNLKVVLPTAASVEVTVVDEQDRPVKGAECLLVQEGRWLGSREIPTRTDERGRAVLGGVTGGRYRVMATSPGTEAFRLAEQKVELRERERRQVRLKFEEGPKLEGVVVDGKGQPVEDAVVLVVPEVVMSSWRSQVRNDSPLAHQYWQRLRAEWEGKEGNPVVTGPDGRFVVQHLLPESYRLTAVKSGYVLDTEALGSQVTGEGRDKGVVAKAGARTPVRLVLAYQGLLRGRVVRQGGEPVTLFTLNNRTLRSEDGTFAVPVAKTGPLEFAFGAEGLATAVRQARMETGKDLDLGDVVLEEGRPVRVRVVEAEGGGPVARAGVFLWKEDGGRSVFTGVAEPTQKDGSVLFPAVELRPMVLEVKHEEYPTTRVPLGPEQREVTVALRPGAVLQGQVRDTTRTVGYGKVHLYMPDGHLKYALEVRDGWYSQRGLEAGHYVARAECAAYPEALVFLPREVDIPESGTVQLDLQSERQGGSLTVQAPEESEDSDDEDSVRLVPGRLPRTGSVAALRVLLLRGHPYDRQYGRPTMVIFRWLAPGPYTLFAWRERGGRLLLHQEEVEMPAGAQRTLRLNPRWQDVGETGERGAFRYGVP